MTTLVRIPTLHTERLTLSAPVEGDFDGYASIVTTERGLGIGGPFSRDEAWLDFAQMAAGWIWRGYGGLSIRSRGARDYLGTVQVHHEFGDAEPEMGWLLTAAAEGKGIAFEAGRAMLDWAWQATALTTLVSYMDPKNGRALRLSSRLGGRPDNGDDGPVSYRGCDFVTYRYRRAGE
ncbi:MAG: GNAT family N-acetyltransferase [Myxococcales bacterium]|nr:GNAT family N-acetyltransferase [Myxococcales bacterium]MCB9537367.1 GNAT family N-acetyltransferase [Myxococcales bacterium]